LQLGGPDDGIAGIANDVSGPGLGSRGVVHGIPLDPVAHKGTANMDLKGLGDVRVQDNALVLGGQEVLA
jgi:hypothetical protein